MISESEKLEILEREEDMKKKSKQKTQALLDSAMRTYNFASESEAFSFIKRKYAL